MIDFLFLLFNIADRISITGPSISGTSLPLPILVAATETWRRRVASLSTPFWIPHKGLLISAGAMVLRMTLQAGSLLPYVGLWKRFLSQGQRKQGGGSV